MSTIALRAAVADTLRTSDKNVLARMAALTLGPACDRCGGSGHWNNAYVGSPGYTERDHHVATAFNGPMALAYNRVDTACTALGKMSPGANRDAATVALAVTLAEALETVRERTEALAEWLVANPA